MDVLVRLLMLLAGFGLAYAQSPVELVRQKKYAEARRALRGLNEPEDPAGRVAWFRLQAAIASGLGESANAAKQMNAALEIAPGDPGLRVATAVAELQAGQLEAAYRHVSGVESAPAFATLGDIEARRKHPAEAARAYQRAMEMAPEVEAYRVALALQLVRGLAFEAARSLLESSAAVFPRSVRLRILLGVTLYALEEPGKAEAALVDALAIEPDSKPAFEYLARIALDDDAKPDALVLDALCRRDPIVCSALKLRSDPEDRAAAAALARSEAPLARCELGRAYERSERWSEARPQLEACVRADPSPRNRFRLGRIYQRLGMKPDAARQMQLYREALAKESEASIRRLEAVQAIEAVSGK